MLCVGIFSSSFATANVPKYLSTILSLKKEVGQNQWGWVGDIFPLRDYGLFIYVFCFLPLRVYPREEKCIANMMQTLLTKHLSSLGLSQDNMLGWLGTSAPPTLIRRSPCRCVSWTGLNNDSCQNTNNITQITYLVMLGVGWKCCNRRPKKT